MMKRREQYSNFLTSKIQQHGLGCLEEQLGQTVNSEGRNKGNVLSSCCGLAWLDARCPPKPLCHCLSSAGQGRKHTMKDLWAKIRAGRDHSPLTTMGKTD